MGLFSRKPHTGSQRLTQQQQYGQNMLMLLSTRTRTRGYELMQGLEDDGFAEAGIVLGQYAQQKSPRTAKTHFDIAARVGIAEGYWGAAGCIHHHHTPDLTNRADAQWVECCRQAAMGGCADAMNELGNIYNRLDMFTPSMYWYQTADIYEHPQAQMGVRGIAARWLGAGMPDACPNGFEQDKHEIALCFMKIQTQQDITAALQKMMRLALGDSGAAAAAFIAKMYENAGQSPQTVFRWYSVGAQNGDVESVRCLADMTLAGQGAPQDAAAAFRLYEEAAHAGSKQAMFVMGEKARAAGDRLTAAYWYGMSYVRGYENAVKRLEQL